MVLWELTLATAYFLGLRRTYRLALKIQRKFLPQNPRIREFAQRRTRGVFDVAIQVQNKIKDWDVSAGRRLGNFLLRSKNTDSTAAAGPLNKAATSIQSTPEGDAAAKMHLPTKGQLFSPLQTRMKSLRLPSPALSSTFGLKKKDAHNPGRLYSLLSLERARLRNSIIRGDIAAYASLVPKGR